MSERRPTAGWGDVDREVRPDQFIANLDRQHAQPFKQQYKRRSLALLDARPGMCVLEAGCGTGQDAATLAELVGTDGQVIGLDFSQAMVDEARRRYGASGPVLQFVQGDVQALELPDASFDRCRADRTFQHLAEPRRALAELARVLAPGGRLVIAEPDHETRVIDTPYRDVTRRFLQFRHDGMRAPDIAHRLYGWCVELGLVDVAVEPMTEVATDYEAINAVLHYDGGIRLAAEHGAVTAEDAERWIAYVEQAARDGRFFSATTFFLTTARKPE